MQNAQTYQQLVKKLYAKKLKPVIMEIPLLPYLMIDGEGAPEGSPAFQEAIGAVYSIAYTIKFMPKSGAVVPGYFTAKMCPMEALWWMKDDVMFDQKKPEQWRWRIMIMMPGYVTSKIVKQAKSMLEEKGKLTEAARRVTISRWKEGRVVQKLYVGPYDKETQTILEMHAFAEAEGYTLVGKHHEIYMSDPRRVPSSRLKTILRQPIIK